MPSIGEVKEILELILMVGAVLGVLLSPWLIAWGKKHLGVTGHELRIAALETEDIAIRSKIALVETRMEAAEKELTRLVKSDKRIYKISLLLAQEFPDSAKNINLLEDL